MFSTAQFRRIASVVVKASPEAASHLDPLRPRLSELLVNVGAADDGIGEGAWFREQANKPVDHAICARQFTAIRLVPSDGKLRIELFGELAALTALAAGDASRIKHPHGGAAAGVQVTLVAGT